jgi:protein sidekick
LHEIHSRSLLFSFITETTGPLPDNLQNWITELSNVSASDTSALIENLKAATNYQFRVSAVNKVGEGFPSEPSNTLLLPQEVPSAPPSSIVGSARTSSEIIAQWQSVPEEHRNGVILGYMLRYKLNGYRDSPWTYKNITNEAQRSYLIQDLITWKDYIIQIASYNNMGVGVYSEGIRVKTKESVPEEPPTDIKIRVVSSREVFIKWKPPSPQQINGINQGYKIQAWQHELVDDSYRDVVVKTMKVAPNLVNPLAEQNCTLGELTPYTYYNITLLCFTNPGDGARSNAILIRTEEDVPGEVANMQFDHVSDRELTLKWNEPKEQNGIITGYQVRYKIKDSQNTKQVNLTAHDRNLHVTQLKAMTHYWFEVKALTAKGSGIVRTAIIQSGIEPVNPEPPFGLALSNIEAFSVVIQFSPGFDGNSSIIKWVVEAQSARNDLWSVVDEISDPDATTITVKGLLPYTQYKLRIIAVNVAGQSGPSEPTKDFQTIQARPKHAPYNVTVRAMSATDLRVRWIPLQQSEWFGNPKGYNVTYQLIEKDMEAPPTSVLIEDPTSNSYILKNLEEWSLYELVVTACNEVGQSLESNVALERTRESVPSGGPLIVQANATSSTTIVVQWSEIPKHAQNGQIEGYKVLYGAPGNPSIPVLQKTIPNNKTFTTTLTELKKVSENRSWK